MTGVGVLTALGTDATANLQAVLARRPHADLATPLETPPDLPAPPVMAARVAGPDPSQIERLGRPHPDRFSCMAIVAADRAMHDASLPDARVAPERIGSVMATTFGPNETVEQYLRTLLLEGPARVSPIGFSRTVANSAAGLIACRHRLLSASTVLLGASAVGQGFAWIRRGVVDAVLCVGVDALRPTHGWTQQQFGRIGSGLLLGEAAAAVVLEAADSARERGAPIHASLTGYSARFCRASVLDLSEADSRALKGAMTGALQPANGASSAPYRCVSVENGIARLRDAERMAASEVLPSQTTYMSPKLLLGETFGASGELGVALAATWLTNVPEPDVVCVVNASQVGGTVWSSVLRMGTA